MASTAERYHALTKYSEATLRTAQPVDWARQPPREKDIVSNRRLSLRPHLPFAKDPFTGEPLPPPEFQPVGEGPGVAEVSRLLFFTNGVTGVVQFAGGASHPLRAAPSAGALYPTEIYVASRDVHGLADGIYNYQVHGHSLVPLWDGDHMQELQEACGGHAAFDEARLCVLLTGCFWRSAWRYQERGYRRVLLDTGHVLANLHAYAPHEGLAAVPVLGFCDAAVNGLLFFDEAVEATLCCVPLVGGDARPAADSLLASAARDAGGLEAAALRSEADLPGSATRVLHRASSCRMEARPVRAPTAPRGVCERAIPLPRPRARLAEEPRLILQRRSARRYAGGPLPLKRLSAALGYAFGRGRRRAVRYQTRDVGLLRAFLVAIDVEGLEPGVYEVEGHGEALLPLSLGLARDDLYHGALGQDIAGNCSAALAFAAPAAEAVALLGDRAYRYLHLEAGEAGERFQLAAVGVGAAACGIGGFLDDDVARLLTIDPDDWVLYLVTIGVPG